MKVKSESEVTQSRPTLSDPMDGSPPGSSLHEIFQARVLEWGAKSLAVSYKTKRYPYHMSQQPCFLGIYPKELKTGPHKKLHTDVHSSFTPNCCPNVEATKQVDG